MPEKDRKKPIPILTPFGKVEVPQPELPPTEPPKMTKRRHEAMKDATATTLGQVLGLLPVVGDAMADVVEDLHGKELRDTLTERELTEYQKQDKVSPSVIALARTFMKIREKK